MSISDSQYNAWLKSQTKRVILIEYQYVIIDIFEETSEIKKGYAANAAYVSGPSDTPANTAYDDILDGEIVFNRSVPISFGGGSNISKGDISLIITDQIAPILYEWFNFQPINIFLGDESWQKSDFRKVMSGTIKNKRIDNNRLVLSFGDSLEAINVPFKRTYISDAGVADGDAVPLCFGKCYNISPLLIDNIDYIYKIHNEWVHSVIDVRDDGVSVGYTWNFAQATITLDAAPSGVITCDVEGNAPSSAPVSGYQYSPANVARAMIMNYGAALYGTGLGIDIQVDDESFDFLNMNNDKICGIYITDANATILQSAETVLRSIGAYMYVNKDGAISVGQLTDFAPTSGILITPSEIAENSVKVKQFIAPEYSVSLGYKKNWTIQNTVASSVSEADRKYYASPYLVNVSENALIKSLYNGSQAGAETETLLADKTECAAECDRRLVLTAAPRTVFELTVLNSVDGLEIGDELFIDYGAPNTAITGIGYAQVTSSYEKISAGIATIEVLV